ncbi:MAG TPA: hypothetical protein VG273_09870, partial [Bryobacteraceae bacterium]|nr:hypothetical protein [Bryobacteraceae bacterium]
MERIVAATTHGRCLVIPAEISGPAPILGGFHGYGEDAETQLERLRAIPGSSRWHCISIQGLHRFYERRTNRVVASWMTRQNRELAIADNIAYVSNCIEQLAAEWPVQPKIVFAGFSQGVGMAFRAAVSLQKGPAGVIAVGGDIPPEIGPEALANVSAAMVARGATDPWYSGAKFATDQKRLTEAGASVHAL